MRATIIHGPHDVRIEEVPAPTIHAPHDAVIRVLAACVCGSDLWHYRGQATGELPRPIGHEVVGVVEEVGADVATLSPGDVVVSPFFYCCGECRPCRWGMHTNCEVGGWYGAPDREGNPLPGCQGELLRVPRADGTLVRVDRPEADIDETLLKSVLTVSDVMGTGHHAVVAAGTKPGDTVAVVGDGAVGLCAVAAARRIGAERIVLFSRYPQRQEIGRTLGATDILTERGEEGVAALTDLLGGYGADVVVEAVGQQESLDQALASARPGGRVGVVGVPHGVQAIRPRALFNRNIGVSGGVAPVRAYTEELLADVRAGSLDPSPVFDLVLPLAEVGEAYAAMDERRAVKVMLRP